jgi:hypothetical protein
MEMFVHLPWWVWLFMSIVPYSIKRKRTVRMQSLVLSALFWKFSFTYQKRQSSWDFSLPWVKRLRKSRSLRKLLTSSWVTQLKEAMKKVLSFWK